MTQATSPLEPDKPPLISPQDNGEEEDDGGYDEPPLLASGLDDEDFAGTVTQRKLEDPTGFWISNEFMDLYARRLGARGVYLYLWLCRAATLKAYPSVKDLARITRKSEYLIARLLFKAFTLGQLNATDMKRLGLPTEIADNDSEEPTAFEVYE